MTWHFCRCADVLNGFAANLARADLHVAEPLIGVEALKSGFLPGARPLGRPGVAEAMVKRPW